MPSLGIEPWLMTSRALPEAIRLFESIAPPGSSERCSCLLGIEPWLVTSRALPEGIRLFESIAPPGFEPGSTGSEPIILDHCTMGLLSLQYVKYINR